MRHSAIFEDEVDFQEHCVGSFLASVVTWALAKQTCGSLRNSVMLLGLDFMPPDQIGPHVLEWIEEASGNYR
jgi:hypothetical protein